MTSRRTFITQSALAFTALSASRVLGANDTIRIASIGLGGQGLGNAGRMAKVPGVEIAYLCDPDTAALDKAKKVFPNAKTTQDLRKVMEDKSIDASTLDIKMGPMLEIDAAKETFTGDTATPEALALLTREYRPGFVVPQAV